LSELSGKVSEGREQVVRGGEFESRVGKQLSELFGTIESHKQMEGFSGVHWKVDFLVDSNLVIEVSVQRRLETKVNSTFLRFVDLTRKLPRIKAALVLEELYVGFHKSQGKKFFPTSEYRTMLLHGFPIVAVNDLAKLVSFNKGETTAFEISSRPSEFQLKAMFPAKHLLGPKILEFLARGPAPRRKIASAIGRSPFLVDDAMKLLPKVKKVSNYYGLSEDEIYRLLIRKKSKSMTQERQIRLWLEEKYLKLIEERGQVRTSEFAAEYGLGYNALGHFLHRLCREGRIRRIRKGEWGSSEPRNQAKLD
jgi:hypothetical protein